jgi:hypothetical protein
MKESVKRIREQMNLPLLLDLAVSPGIPAGNQTELNRALMELLLHVAQEKFSTSSDRGEHDEPSQTHA